MGTSLPYYYVLFVSHMLRYYTLKTIVHGMRIDIPITRNRHNIGSEKPERSRYIDTYVLIMHKSRIRSRTPLWLVDKRYIILVGRIFLENLTDSFGIYWIPGWLSNWFRGI